MQACAERLNERGEEMGMERVGTPRFFEKPGFSLWIFKMIFSSLIEVVEQLEHSKASSSPSPFDQVSYQIFKRCPSHCWTSSTSVG